MTPKDTNDLKVAGRVVSGTVFLVSINAFACYAVPHFLLYAGAHINGLFMPDPPYWINGQLREGLSPLYRIGGLLLILELLGLLFGLYKFNRWYCCFLPNPQASTAAWIATLLASVSIIISVSRWGFLSLFTSLFSN
jgi:hypothetical protein